MMLRGRSFLRLALRSCIAFVMIFSIMLCTCVNDVQAATTLVGDYTYTDSSFNLVGHKTSGMSFDSFPDTMTFEDDTFPTVSENYSVETPRKYFVDSDGNSLILRSNYQYRININMSGSLKLNAGLTGKGESCNARLYMIYGGEKYYFTGLTLMTTIYGANSAYYVIGVEFDVSIPPVFGSAGYSFNYITPTYNFTKVTQQIHQYDGTSSMNSSDVIINSGIQSGNDLQEENNNLQKEENKTTSNIFDSISDFFGSFFDNLIGIFVPEDGYFEDFFARLNQFFSEKLGMLYSPIELFINLLTGIQNASAVDAGIPFPGLKWEDMYIIEPQTISLSEIAGDFPELQEKIYFVTDVIMVGAVVMLLQNKLKEILTT